MFKLFSILITYFADQYFSGRNRATKISILNRLPHNRVAIRHSDKKYL